MKNRTQEDLSAYRYAIMARRKSSTRLCRWARLVELQNAVTRRIVSGAKA